ncbi:host specificity protein [Maritimibacter sp. 55A14]|uniref:baseplate multidomain protein megatron n=1 Tax=Maritimibacter sp. 55A14 TaxID=2174844 RepID=UPI000D61DCA9|nr:glycoside hydrolase/phage tail family protein [Maritimibacter sp. 55A14]PWE30657.1 host specificity protein [Maritimibacter sp. 55A14]
MATILLSAAGASAGAAIGGSVLGLSSAVIGRAAGVTFGRVIDQKLIGQGSDVVETGRVERFRLTGASEGAAIPLTWGQVRVAGQAIWASRFREIVTESGGGGKGAPSPPKTRSFSYTVSLAIALGEGVVTRLGRVWADGVEIAVDDLNLRFYPGDEVQIADPLIEAVEGAGRAPAYRGTAYVVIEDLDLSRFGNRIPQFSFEIFRAARPQAAAGPGRPGDLVRGVALIPGTGEYALATTSVHVSDGPGVNRWLNVNTPGSRTDFDRSLEALREEVPNCGAVSLVVSWFGTDLRAGRGRVEPRVERADHEGVEMPWRVSGASRAGVAEVSRIDGRPSFGGTPADAAVIEAIAALRAAGHAAIFYPFVLMDIPAGNGLADPWSEAEDQPAFPWRGRITSEVAPGRPGSPDGTQAAEAEVARFFGTAQVGDFTPQGAGVVYAGPQEWSYRRFVLHYAHLCALAGGVEAFVIGSELRSLTQIRGAGGSFPAVAALRALAGDVRAILGPETRIGYAADWSEYFGYHPQDGSGDVYFHLDPLWADVAIDFVGVDNYMPVADWREGEDHADAKFGEIYNLDYLRGNIAGGEGFDWFYGSEEERAAQIRTPITDGAYGEPWVFRFKDLRNWWSQPHFERIGGVRQETPTAWEPQSKPFWFTEIGCAAIDKGANEPNKFLDPRSSESSLPRFSNGRRDDLMLLQYLRAVLGFWSEPENNPVSEIYDGSMVDPSRILVWAWDARPWPAFPNNTALWSDGDNFARGHWLNGRLTLETLDDVVAEISERSGMDAFDVSGLYSVLRRYELSDVSTARAAIQPLVLAYGFDAGERGGTLRFFNRDAAPDAVLDEPRLAVLPGEPAGVQTLREPDAETAGRVRVIFVEAGGDYEARAAETIFPDEETRSVAQTDLPLALTRTEGQAAVECWLATARVGRDTARFALPPSAMHLGAGDVVLHRAGGDDTLYRIDRVEEAGARLCDAVRVERGLYAPSDETEQLPRLRAFAPVTPVFPQFLDLPLLTGDEVAHAPHLAVSATPWPGTVAVYSAPFDEGYTLNRLFETPSVVGVTETVLVRAPSGRWDRGPALRVRMFGGALSSVSAEQVLAGANALAIGDGSTDNWEVLQFRDAVLVDEGRWDLTLRLRGQAGTDGIQPDAWPVGSRVVLLNGAPAQVDLPLSARDLERNFRIGPAQRPVDDPVFVHVEQAFRGIGLRPYAPVHLRMQAQADGALDLSWVRRSRIDGDSWSSIKVPLGETREAYRVRVIRDGVILREAETTAPGWRYTAAAQAEDGVAVAFELAVAQLSDSFGPGPFASVEING